MLRDWMPSIRSPSAIVWVYGQVIPVGQIIWLFVAKSALDMNNFDSMFKKILSKWNHSYPLDCIIEKHFRFFLLYFTKRLKCLS